MCTIFTTGKLVLAFMVKFSSTWVWHWLVSTSSFLLGVMWFLSLLCVGSAQPFYTISCWYSLGGQLLRQCGSTLSWSRSLEYSHSRQDSLSKLAYLHGVNCDYVTNGIILKIWQSFIQLCFSGSSVCDHLVCRSCFQVLHQPLLVSVEWRFYYWLVHSLQCMHLIAWIKGCIQCIAMNVAAS